MSTKAERKAARRAAKQAEEHAKQTPSPSELLGKTPEATENPAEPEKVAEETTEVKETAEVAEETTEQVEETAQPEASEEPKGEASTLEDMVNNLPENLREKAMAELSKLKSQAERNQQAKQWVGFDSALKDEAKGLPKFIGDLAKEHGVDLSGRRITITYPDGKFSYTNSPKGSKNGGGGTRSGFPEPWGEATLVKGGKEVQKEKSPAALAKAMGLQVEGMRDMKDVFENPHQAGSKAELPKLYKVDAVRGEYFRVIQQ